MQSIEPSGDSFPSSRRGWYAVSILAAAVLLSFTDRLVINLLVDDIRLDLGISYFEISLLQGLGFGLIYAACALPLGRLADSSNRRNLVMLAIATWSLGTALRRSGVAPRSACSPSVRCWARDSASCSAAGCSPRFALACSVPRRCSAPCRRGAAC